MESLWRLARTVMALGGVAALLVLAPALNRTAWAAEEYDVYYVAYFDVASHSVTTAGGYGGFGASGGNGDSLVRVINPSHAETLENGTLCAMFYVFDDNEQMQTCCGCPVTPDGLRTASVINDMIDGGFLSSNGAINKNNLSAGVIKLISAEPNWAPPTNNQTLLPPPGVGYISAPTPGGCDPSGITTGLTSFGCTIPPGRQIGGTNTSGLTPTQELRAWLNHTESIFTPPSSFTMTTSVEKFADATLDITELCNLETSCGFLVADASGAGTCSCGTGDSTSTFRPKR